MEYFTVFVAVFAVLSFFTLGNVKCYPSPQSQYQVAEDANTLALQRLMASRAISDQQQQLAQLQQQQLAQVQQQQLAQAQQQSQQLTQAQQQQQDAHQYFAALQQFYAASSKLQQQPSTSEGLAQQNPGLLQYSQSAQSPSVSQFQFPKSAQQSPLSAQFAQSQLLPSQFGQSNQNTGPVQFQTAASNNFQQPSQQPAPQQSPLGVQYSSAAEVSRTQFSGNGINYSF